MELLNVKEEAKNRFNTVYHCVNRILGLQESFNLEYLQKYYLILLKNEAREQARINTPVIGKIYAQERINTYFTSDAILRVAQFMKRCGLSQIDKANFQELEDKKEKIYDKLFREDYENEVKVYNNKIDAKNCLFPAEQENC